MTHGDPLKILVTYNNGQSCTEEGCDKCAKKRKRCLNHYKQWLWKNSHEYRIREIKKNKDRYRLNRRRYLDQMKEYRRRPDVQKRIRTYSKQYRQTAKYKASHNNVNARRKAQQKFTDITTDWLLALSKNTTTCEVCSLPLGEDRHLDHIIPLNPKAGGTHMKDNVRYIHALCNLRRPDDGSDLIKTQENNLAIASS